MRLDQLTWTLGGGKRLPACVGELMVSAGTLESYPLADPSVVEQLDRSSLTWLEKLVITVADPFARGWVPTG